MWQQKHLTMTKHAHREAILPMKMSISLERSIKTWSCFCGSLMLVTFKIACSGSSSFGETPELESFFSRQSLLDSPLVVWRLCGEEMSLVRLTFVAVEF